jgi:HlyD family secretion protein
LKKKYFAIAGMTCLILGIVALNLLKGTKGPVVAVATAAVETKELKTKIFAAGKVTADQEQKLYANADGILVDLKVEAGSEVKAGDVLAVFATDELERQIRESEANLALQRANLVKAQAGAGQAELEQAKAKLAQSEKELEAARSKEQRTAKLYKEGAVTKEQMDQAIEEAGQKATALLVAQKAYEILQSGETPAVIAALKAQVAQAETALENLREKLAGSVLEAGLDGIVTFVGVEEGQRVAQGTLTMSVGQKGNLKVVADINEGDVPQIKLGQKTEVTGIAFPGLALEGKVTKVSAAAMQKNKDQGQQTVVPIEVTLANHPDLKPGFSAELNIITNHEPQALVVPHEALQEKDAEKWVFVAEGERAHKRIVKTGLSNEIYMAITSGLKPGELVILNPPQGLLDKGRVKILD